jgi:hypothetical protein
MATSPPDDATPWFARGPENRPNTLRPSPAMVSWASRVAARLTQREPWVYAEAARGETSRPAAVSASGPRGARPVDRGHRVELDPRAVPPEVSERLVRVGSDYYLANGTHALRDRGSKIIVRSDNTEVIRSAVLIAPERGWSDITVSGATAFRRQAWREGTAIGLIVRGYKPTEFEKAQFVRARAQERRAETSSVSAPPTASPTASSGRRERSEPASTAARKPDPADTQTRPGATPTRSAASPAANGAHEVGNGRDANPSRPATRATTRDRRGSPDSPVLQDTLELTLRDPQAAARYVRREKPEWANAVVTMYAAGAFAKQALRDEADRQAFLDVIIADLQRSHRSREATPAPRLRERVAASREPARTAEPRGRSPRELS